MIPTIHTTLQYLLIDTENAQLILSEASKKINQQPAYKSSSIHTISKMKEGKFGRLFNRHHAAYRLFN